MTHAWAILTSWRWVTQKYVILLCSTPTPLDNTRCYFSPLRCSGVCTCVLSFCFAVTRNRWKIRKHAHVVIVVKREFPKKNSRLWKMMTESLNVMSAADCILHKLFWGVRVLLVVWRSQVVAWWGCVSNCGGQMLENAIAIVQSFVHVCVLGITLKYQRRVWIEPGQRIRPLNSPRQGPDQALANRGRITQNGAALNSILGCLHEITIQTLTRHGGQGSTNFVTVVELSWIPLVLAWRSYRSKPKRTRRWWLPEHFCEVVHLLGRISVAVWNHMAWILCVAWQGRSELRLKYLKNVRKAVLLPSSLLPDNIHDCPRSQTYSEQQDAEVWPWL